MKVGVDLHRGSKFVKLSSSFKNLSLINSETRQGGMGDCVFLGNFGDF